MLDEATPETSRQANVGRTWSSALRKHDTWVQISLCHSELGTCAHPCSVEAAGNSRSLGATNAPQDDKCVLYPRLLFVFLRLRSGHGVF